MSLSHLKELRDALLERGWFIVEERLRGEWDVGGAATWEIQRDASSPSVLIDFAGFGPMGEDIPLEKSYSCDVRGRNVGLYFWRINRSRERWLQDLADFLDALDKPVDL